MERKGRQTILFLLEIIAAGIVIYAGCQMLGIHSEASQLGHLSVAEVYYHTMGLGFVGFGIFAGSAAIGHIFKD